MPLQLSKIIDNSDCNYTFVHVQITTLEMSKDIRNKQNENVKDLLYTILLGCAFLSETIFSSHSSVGIYILIIHNTHIHINSV